VTSLVLSQRAVPTALALEDLGAHEQAAALREHAA
jgi:hypothetical protein